MFGIIVKSHWFSLWLWPHHVGHQPYLPWKFSNTLMLPRKVVPPKNELDNRSWRQLEYHSYATCKFIKLQCTHISLHLNIGGEDVKWHLVGLLSLDIFKRLSVSEITYIHYHFLPRFTVSCVKRVIFFLLYNYFFIYQVLCTLIHRLSY